MARRITILGMGPSAYQRALHIEQYTEGTEVWGVNNGYLQVPALREKKGFARIFELHAWSYLRTWDAGSLDNGQKIDHFAELQRLGCPVYAGEHLPVVTNQVHFPWDAVANHFAISDDLYFLGTPSLMLALALYEHDQGDEIEYLQSWGIDTDPKEPQHAQQRQSWTYWVAKAEERGITLGGTATMFKNEYERDAGLTGVREELRKRLKSRRTVGPITDYAVASFCTDDPYYQPMLERLGKQATELGLDFVSRVVPVPEGRTAKEVAREFPASMIRELMEEVGKPILYVDADDELLVAPSFPECDVGMVRNPELDSIPTHLQHAPFFFVNNTEKGVAFLKLRETLHEALGVNMHRTLCAAWTLAHTKSNQFGTILDVTTYARGCIRYNPSPHGHRSDILTT